ncbi:MAG: undecaprenyl-diphosphate phosphatase, partial [Candidatus Hydrogenedentota bacterium]
FIFFRGDLIRLIKKIGTPSPERKLFIYLILGTIPLLLIPFYKDFVEKTVNSITAIGIFFLVNAFILFMGERIKRKHKYRLVTEEIYRTDEAKWYKPFMIGFAQLLAVFPGISRSGSTISTALAFNFSGIEAVRFSFLLSIPALLGATGLEVKDLLESGNISAIPWLWIVIGTLSSFVAGLLSLKLLMWIGKKLLFYPFAIYTFLLGSFILIWK